MLQNKGYGGGVASSGMTFMTNFKKIDELIQNLVAGGRTGTQIMEAEKFIYFL
jgi:hypothetical protein